MIHSPFSPSSLDFRDFEIVQSFLFWWCVLQNAPMSLSSASLILALANSFAPLFWLVLKMQSFSSLRSSVWHTSDILLIDHHLRFCCHGASTTNISSWYYIIPIQNIIYLTWYIFDLDITRFQILLVFQWISILFDHCHCHSLPILQLNGLFSKLPML